MNSNKTKQKAIFDFYLGGHHIEYLHHIYMYAIEDVETSYTFILPSNFSIFGKQMLWPNAENVRFIFYELDDKYVRSLKAFEKARLLSKLLNKYAKETGINEFFLIETMVFMPYLPFYIGRKIKITSILYSLSLFNKDVSFKGRAYSYFLYWLLAKSPCFKKICLLNSTEAVDYYNKKYQTNKFSFLPDPFVPIKCAKSPIDIREYLDIASSKTVFIHFGGLTKRKGTLDILDALFLVDESKLEKKCFIFAGRVIEDIRDEFYDKVERLKAKVQIVIFDKFCEYSLFAEICTIADYIIIPYKNTAQSSGVCSYAAQFGVPVIGPHEGLLGYLIRDNEIGHTIKNINAEKIAEFVQNEEYKRVIFNHLKAEAYIKSSAPKIFFNYLVGK